MTTILIKKTENNKQPSINPIHRFKFSPEFIEVLYSFSNMHKNDERKHFKEEWNKYLVAESVIFTSEINNLKQLGFTGDILDKMFKSARYYFRKKTINIDIKKDKTPRQCYKCVSTELHESIDKHIKTTLEKGIKPKPSLYYEYYSQENKELIDNEIRRLNNGNDYDVQIDSNKIKKTYKNRYYLIIFNK